MSDSGVKYDCVTYTGTHPSKRSKVTVLIDGILVASACLPLVAKGCYCPPPPLRGHKDKGFGFGLEARSLVWGAEGGGGAWIINSFLHWQAMFQARWAGQAPESPFNGQSPFP